MLSEHHRFPPRARAKVGARGEGACASSGAFVPGREQVLKQALVITMPSR